MTLREQSTPRSLQASGSVPSKQARLEITTLTL
jgi:hypothetical protein